LITNKKWEPEISSQIALQVQIKTLVPLLFLMKSEDFNCGEAIGREVEDGTLFFFLWDDKEFCFLFFLRVSVLRLCKLILPPSKLTSMWIRGVFPVDIAVSE
jgi:hypothetical protein